MPIAQLIGGVGHVISAFLFAGIALWALMRPPGGMRRRSLAGAALVTTIWSAAVIVHGDRAIIPGIIESLRNLAWLGLMLLLLARGQREARQTTLFILYAVLGAVILAEVSFDLLFLVLDGTPKSIAVFSFIFNVLRMIFAVGALVLVHNLYTAAAPEARWGIRLPMTALALMWVYDLNLYTMEYLTGSPSDFLLAGRGLLMVGVAALIGLSSRRNTQWKMRLSRAVTFRSLSLLAIGGYLIVMVLIVRALDIAGIARVELVQVTVIIAMSALGVMILPSRKLRAWFRVKLIKHFFQHRYDYRAEWLRFTETLGRPGPDAPSLDERVIKAIADMTESPGGVLLLPTGDGDLATAARWSWPDLDVPVPAGNRDFAEHCARAGRIIEIEAVRRSRGVSPNDAVMLPQWMLDSASAWAVVPLLHFDRLSGVVVLERPVLNRVLDWEDFDLLRLAGRQVASYLAEASSQEALSDARRFDEFNRRFAFIMHDVKNLVSQLALVARNAERHADNPAFREDMVATLKSSVGKMNDLLARLSPHDRGRILEQRTMSLRGIADAVRASRSGGKVVHVEGKADILATGDPRRLEQALGHILQNAVEASPESRPVLVKIEQRGCEAVISVIDRGEGMSAEFVRNELFRPFSSTKADGFGVGAHEARSLISAMGGRIEVSSRAGEGSRFDIILPSADRGVNDLGAGEMGRRLAG